MSRRLQSSAKARFWMIVAAATLLAAFVTATALMRSSSRQANTGGAPASPGDFTFTTIDFPGAGGTAANGINNLGQIVGGYGLADGSKHGFLDVAGTFTTVDDPAATAGTGASDINGSGQIAGSYDFTDPGHPFEGAHGFLFSRGSFTPIDYPATGVTSTTPNGINDSGAVVGVYRTNSPGNGFLYSGGAYAALDVPAALGCCTHANGINNAGQIVGQYKTPDATGPTHGFLDTGGTFSTIDFPGAAATQAQGINNLGDVVGSYATNTNAIIGFLYTGGSFFTIAFPGAVTTQCGHINDIGEIVGFYVDSGMSVHGFRATPVTPTPTSTPTPPNTPVNTPTITPVPPTKTPSASNTLTALSPARVWVGLPNGNDKGLRLDLKAEVLINSTPVGTGELDNVNSPTGDFQSNMLNTINLALTNGPVSLSPGDRLQLRVSVRPSCFGKHKVPSGTARLWYDGAAVGKGARADAGSRFDATTGGSTSDYFLRAGFNLATTAGSSRTFIDELVFRVGGACPFTEFGTWSITR